MTTRARRSVARKTSPKDANGSSVTRAFHELSALIVRGDPPPGAWIIESEVPRLGLSRTPIRGVLQWLRREATCSTYTRYFERTNFDLQEDFCG